MATSDLGLTTVPPEMADDLFLLNEDDIAGLMSGNHVTSYQCHDPPQYSAIPGALADPQHLSQLPVSSTPAFTMPQGKVVSWVDEHMVDEVNGVVPNMDEYDSILKNYYVAAMGANQGGTAEPSSANTPGMVSCSGALEGKPEESISDDIIEEILKQTEVPMSANTIGTLDNLPAFDEELLSDTVASPCDSMGAFPVEDGVSSSATSQAYVGTSIWETGVPTASQPNMSDSQVPMSTKTIDYISPSAVLETQGIAAPSNLAPLPNTSPGTIVALGAQILVPENEKNYVIKPQISPSALILDTQQSTVPGSATGRNRYAAQQTGTGNILIQLGTLSLDPTKIIGTKESDGTVLPGLILKGDCSEKQEIGKEEEEDGEGKKREMADRCGRKRQNERETGIRGKKKKMEEGKEEKGGRKAQLGVKKGEERDGRTHHQEEGGKKMEWEDKTDGKNAGGRKRRNTKQMKEGETKTSDRVPMYEKGKQEDPHEERKRKDALRAHINRERKKQKVTQLEETVKDLEAEKGSLLEELERLKARDAEREQKMADLEKERNRWKSVSERLSAELKGWRGWGEALVAFVKERFGIKVALYGTLGLSPQRSAPAQATPSR